MYLLLKCLIKKFVFNVFKSLLVIFALDFIVKRHYAKKKDQQMTAFSAADEGTEKKNSNIC